MFNLLIGLAVILLVVLIAYAWHLQRRLQTLEQNQINAAQEREQKRQQQQREASRGIRVLATAMVREEVTLTEGSMRIAYLLAQVDEEARQKPEYSSFFQLAEATAHIPVLEAWKALSNQQRRAFNMERMKTEQGFHEFVLNAAEQLLNDSVLNDVIVNK